MTHSVDVINSGKAHKVGNQYLDGVVYLIHFSRPYKQSQHYLGWTHSFEARMERHRSGRGSNLIKVIQEAGIDWEVVRIWEPASPKVESELKKFRNNRRLCPICQGRYALEKADNLKEARRLKLKERTT